MPEGGEISKSQLSTSDQMKVKRADLNAVADLAEQWGHSEKAEQLRQLVGQPSTKTKPVAISKPTSEKQPLDSPASTETRRFDTQDVEVLLNAAEQAKKFPVPEGEEPGQFYYRKTMEILSQRKEQQK